MRPCEIYSAIETYVGNHTTIICDLHSACSPQKDRYYLCNNIGSKTSVIDFDNVKTLVDTKRKSPNRKSVDALAITPSHIYLCFIELKSWELLISHNGNEENVRKQATKYSSDLPQKLSDSIQICKEITNDTTIFQDCKILYILLTDISVTTDGIQAFNTDLTALAGTSSDLKELCNSLSQDIMDKITSVETRYWECRDFDKNFSTL